jgi:hypothetical protein
MGIEPPANSPEKTAHSAQGGAKSGAPAMHSPAIEPDLAVLIDAWPALPAAVPAGIVAMVKAATAQGGGQ